ncbi:NTP transferase domain-containing protein [Roseomonas sp. OT10]|uniref:nucleotidyltransferase family protein n=1 Tax=Roseomonas cutis TaxID=2897332 RepID=UPI001E4A8CD4|nr:sugar phosphate nucleotidyltransferase [Roseomonas sp. OT10]UFN49766.1 NTP transferase domain-containing protein [Roseomonas sp. OT10]
MKAVILAGGKGTRLAPYTTVLPKPLVPVGGIPIVETVLRQLRHHGFTEVVLAVGYLSPLIRAYFDPNPLTQRMWIRYHQESEPLGTAGALASIEGLNEDFLAMNGDLLTTLDYAAMMRFHRERDATLTVAVTDRRYQIEVGVLGIEPDQRITGYTEKPVQIFPASMGIYICSPRIFGFMEPGKPLDVPSLVVRLIEAGQPVLAYRSEASWLDMGNPTDYARASEAFEGNRSAFLPDGA